MTQPASHPLTIRTREEMSPEYFETVSKMLRSQAYRELAAAVVFAEALSLVPTVEFKRHVVHTVEEEMEHDAIYTVSKELGARLCLGAHFERVRVTKKEVVTDGEDNLTLGVWVTVENVNDEPVVHFLGPEPGSRYGLGETILFTANATDEDGDQLTYTWMLDDEPLGFGRDLEVDWLPVGRHDVKLEVSDGSAEVWTSLDVRVEAEEEEGPSWAYWTVILLALAVVAVVVSVLFNRRAQSGGRSSQP